MRSPPRAQKRDFRVVGFGYLESLELWLVLKWHLLLEIHLNKSKNRGKLYCLEEAKNMEGGGMITGFCSVPSILIRAIFHGSSVDETVPGSRLLWLAFCLACSSWLLHL